MTTDPTVVQLQAGWQFAVGALLGSGAMQRVSELPIVEDDAESMGAFFNNTCAPRSTNLTSNAPVIQANGTGGQWSGICTGCRVSTLHYLTDILLLVDCVLVCAHNESYYREENDSRFSILISLYPSRFYILISFTYTT